MSMKSAVFLVYNVEDIKSAIDRLGFFDLQRHGHSRPLHSTAKL